jgi:hypothetical protein
MTYTVTTTAGATIATVADGTVNTTATSLTLIGKNYAGYGIFLNENYVQLLENFSNSTAPTAPLTGQLWYDNVNDILKVYNAANNVWKPISSAITQATSPSAAISVTGDIWWDTTNAQLKVWSGSAWITIGPTYTSTSGTSGPVTESILDTSAVSHNVTKFYVSNTVVAILSKDATFTPQTAIPGFSTIIPGMNLISPSTLAGAQFTGATTGASTLGGFSASQFLRSDISQTTNYAFGAAGGLTVGGDLTFDTTSGTAVVAETTSNRNIRIDVNKSGVTTPALTIAASTNTIQVANALTVAGVTTGTFLNLSGNVVSTGAVHNALTVNGVTTHSGNIIPSSNNVAYLGNATNRYNTIYGVNIDVLSLTSGTGTVFSQLNSSGNVLAQGGVFSSLAVNGAITQVGTLTISGGFVNAAGNILSTGAIHNSLTVNGTTTSTGFINTSANISAAVGVFGAINSTGFINTSANISASQGRFGTIITTGSITPTANAAADLGTSLLRYSTIYGVTVNALSVTANYADLAERFEADAPMLPGTVVEIGGLKEITAAVQELSEKVFGVISTAAGFLLNGAAGTNVTHPPVAVNGRVPVRVIGQVTKGDRLVSAGNGLARAALRSEMTAFNVIGRALENKTTTGEGTIEAIVKLNS